MSELRALVLSYRDYEIDQLAKAYVSEEELKDLINRLSSVVILQTCNRIEYYLDNKEDFEFVNKLIIERSGLKPRTYEGLDAVKHLLMVTAGLDSMFFGEREILAQVKRALSMSKPSNSLKRLFEMAIRFGERFRREHDLTEISFIKFLSDFVVRSIDSGARVLIIGGGEVARGVARGLIKYGFNNITIANRSLDRLTYEFRDHGVKLVSLNELRDEILTNHYDLMLSAISVDSPIINLSDVPEGRMPRLIIDVSTPRSVDVDGKYKGKVVLLEDLRNEYIKYVNGKYSTLDYANDIESEARRIFRLLIRGKADDVVREVMEFVESIREEEVREALNAIKGGEDPENVIEAMSRSLVKKLMHNYLENIRKNIELGKEDLVNILKDSLMKIN